MITLSYVSCASHRFSNDELISLLQECHQNNQKHHITGLLLYNGAGTFLQVLEGDADIIDRLYMGIASDKRHHRVNCIHRNDIEKRNFPDWKMGFRNLASHPLNNLDGFSDFMEAEDSIEFLTTHSDFAMTMLKHFKSTSEEILI